MWYILATNPGNLKKKSFFWVDLLLMSACSTHLSHLHLRPEHLVLLLLQGGLGLLQRGLQLVLLNL